MLPMRINIIGANHGEGFAGTKKKKKMRKRMEKKLIKEEQV